MWFTPARPRPWYVVWSAATLSGVRIATMRKRSRCGLLLRGRHGRSPARYRRGEAINAGCCDISKSRVAAGFEQAAGYPLAIDATTFAGVAVEKSEINGRHDGRLVSCPLIPQIGKAYQVFVDSSDGDDAFDFRTTIIDRKPLFVLVKTRPVADRFSIHNATVTFKPLQEAFSPSDIALITRFAEQMKLDWAAIDVLRDRASGRIYIVDVNKTDTGPAVDLSRKDRERLKAAISHAFREMIERWSARS